MKEKLLFSLLVAEWLDGDRWIEVRPFWEEYPETGRTAGARVGFMPEPYSYNSQIQRRRILGVLLFEKLSFRYSTLV